MVCQVRGRHLPRDLLTGRARAPGAITLTRHVANTSVRGPEILAPAQVARRGETQITSMVRVQSSLVLTKVLTLRMQLVALRP